MSYVTTPVFYTGLAICLQFWVQDGCGADGGASEEQRRHKAWEKENGIWRGFPASDFFGFKGVEAKTWQGGNCMCTAFHLLVSCSSSINKYASLVLLLSAWTFQGAAMLFCREKTKNVGSWRHRHLCHIIMPALLLTSVTDWPFVRNFQTSIFSFFSIK